ISVLLDQRVDGRFVSHACTPVLLSSYRLLEARGTDVRPFSPAAQSGTVRAMPDAVVVSTARTPLCKSWRGALNMTHGATMGGHVVKQALERAKLDPVEVEDVIMG